VQPDPRDVRIAELESELAAKDAVIAEQAREIEALRAQVAELVKRVEELSEIVGRNSRNSHLPPSSDPPGSASKRGRGKPKSGRKRGGQRGHRGHRRELLPPEKVKHVVDLFPPACESCWKPLPKIPDAAAKRYQVTELPPIEPETTEYRRHAVGCNCGHVTRAPYDAKTIPASPFGPRLMAAIGLLTGVFNLSRRKAGELLCDIAGVRISLGGLSAVEARVSSAVEAPVEQAWQHVERAPVKHTDGTGWLQAGVPLALWTIATAMATVFKIVTTGSKVVLQPLYGALNGIVVSDRAKALNFWAMERRQICWAHLLRKFVSFSERDGPAAALGRELLDYTELLFEYWHDFKDGKLTRDRLRSWMAPVRQQVEAVLQRAVAAKLDHVSGSCADILDHQAAMWTFVDNDGVDPTNNHAERELRAFVLWRKRSFASQSERGNRFAERLMTVAHTARKQNRNVLEFLTECCEAQLSARPAPSLFAREPAAAA
jgi:transposase